MKAVRLHGPGDLRVEDVAAPDAPRAGWAMLRVRAAGICGSDLHNFRTGQWITRAPSIAGHELTGEVVALGDHVEGLAVGDRVVADSRFWCGECARCRAGQRHLCASLGFIGEVCDGGFAEQVCLPARLLHRVGPDVADEVAAMAEPLAVALHAIRRLPKAGGAVLVAGCGPIGGLAALLLSRSGARKVLVSDRNEARAALVAKVTGATVADLDPRSVAAATADPLLGAVEATGNTQVLRSVLDLVQPGGAVALVGIFHDRLDIDPNMLIEREIALLGCHAFADELPEAVAMLGGLAAQMSAMIDRRISLDEVPEAYERLLSGRAGGLKTLIRMDGEL